MKTHKQPFAKTVAEKIRKEVIYDTIPNSDYVQDLCDTYGADLLFPSEVKAVGLLKGNEEYAFRLGIANSTYDGFIIYVRGDSFTVYKRRKGTRYIDGKQYSLNVTVKQAMDDFLHWKPRGNPSGHARLNQNAKR